MHSEPQYPPYFSMGMMFFLGISFLSASTSISFAEPLRQGEAPNILFILIDDHPANMVSVLGESVVHTPNIERLAARGTWFTHAYNAAPLCGASRAAILTGVHPSNSGAYVNANAWKRTDQPIAQAESLHEIFLKNGYLTAGYGKIDHTPWQWDTLDDFTPGFRIGHRNDPNVESYTDEQLAEFIIPETLRVPDPDYLVTRFGALPDDWDREDPKKLQEDTQHANQAIEFLQQDHGQAFFLTCGFWRPHSERIVPKRYFDKYPTLLTLCKLPQPTRQTLDGVDLTPLLKRQTEERGKPVLTTFTRGNHSVRDRRFRYTRYDNEEEELYDHENDPYEWTNLAKDPKFERFKEDLSRWLPETDAPAIGRGADWKGL